MAAILLSRMEVSYCTFGFFRSPPSNFDKLELPFQRGLKSPTQIDYRAGNRPVMIMCPDRAK